MATGLTPAEAQARLAAEGPNALPGRDATGLARLLREVMTEPMFGLLLACGAIYLVLGDPQEAMILLGFVFLVAAITVVQGRRTERALAALRDLSSPRALVIRGGERLSVAGRDVVRGDLTVLVEGDRVPADVALIETSHLQVDESLLTGESVPVTKSVWDGQMALARPGGDGLAFAFAGSLVVRGTGLAEVLATGPRTAMGSIGRALQTALPERTRLQHETGRLVGRLAIVAAALSAVVLLVEGLAYHRWLDGLLAGLTLAMALLPNEFPAILTVFLALGAWRMAQKQVLTRRVPALEALGAATVLCVDKTGTLTCNRMTVRSLDAGPTLDLEAGAELPEWSHELVEYGILASQRDPFDPMERAFHDLGQRQLAGTEHLHPDWTLMREYPLSGDLLALSHVWQSPDGQALVVAAKGAPEAIADLCHLPEPEVTALRIRVETMANQGLRVLGVARATFGPLALPPKQHDFDFELVGLVGLADPVREDVPAAVAECHTAGLRVIMLTGDHPLTALSIARQIGLRAETVLTAADLDTMDDAALSLRVAEVDVFARVVPEQKLRLVRVLQARGEVVAMTGDGVNDAPALRAADIGVAMGGRGTDVAREAAALVLLDDDFTSIVEAVRVGRRVFDNLRKAMAYVLAVHVPIAGLTVLPALLDLPMVLMPVHIAFLHLVIEPVCAVVFEVEAADPTLMQRPPRRPDARLFDRSLWTRSLLQGSSVLIAVLALYLSAVSRLPDGREARGLAFTTLMLANLLLILVNRSARHAGEARRPSNRPLAWLLVGTLVCLAVALYVPGARRFFGVTVLHADDVALCIGAALVSVTWLELLGRLNRLRPAQSKVTPGPHAPGTRDMPRPARS
jgi:Ca2+-transporting ATPase